MTHDTKILRDQAQSLFPRIKISISIGNVQELPWILRVVINAYIFRVSYFPLVRLKKKSARIYNNLLSIVDKIDQRDAAELHSDYESLVEEMELISQRIEKDFPRRILKLVYEILEIYKKAEKISFERAYPDYHKPMADEHGAKIKKLFKGWEEDWGDKKMDVYND